MEDTEIRSIDELARITLGEMTPAELEIWFEYQKEIAARDAATLAKTETINNYLNAVASVHRENAEAIRERFLEYTKGVTNG